VFSITFIREAFSYFFAVNIANFRSKTLQKQPNLLSVCTNSFQGFKHSPKLQVRQHTRIQVLEPFYQINTHHRKHYKFRKKVHEQQKQIQS